MHKATSVVATAHTRYARGAAAPRLRATWAGSTKIAAPRVMLKIAAASPRTPITRRNAGVGSVTRSRRSTRRTYWAARLCKRALRARQLSPRGGELRWELAATLARDERDAEIGHEGGSAHAPSTSNPSRRAAWAR